MVGSHLSMTILLCALRENHIYIFFFKGRHVGSRKVGTAVVQRLKEQPH
jgi:hypothetical protein